MRPLSFEWDPAKSAVNLQKHGVAFDEALTAFMDPLAKIHSDPDHSIGEKREILVGHSARGRLLIVAFAQRRRRVRLISARLVTRKERRDYEEG